MESHFGRRLKAKIEQAINERATSIASGACTDYAHYRENVGFVEGLMAAVNFCADLEKDHD